MTMLLEVGRDRVCSRDMASNHRRTGQWLPLFLLFLLTAAAAALRLYHLDTLPPGLHHDEASNGMLARHILAGHTPVFFSDYTGKEAAYMYLVAAAIHLVGPTVLAIRLPAALAGVALVPAIFLVGRRTIGERGAILAAALTTVAPWLLHLNRIGFRANLLPLLLTLWVWLLLRSLAPGRNTWSGWAGAGLCLGLTAHTYTASRLVPLLVVLFVAYLAVWHRPVLQRCWRGLLLMLVLAALVTAPLLLHFLRYPSDWGERLGQIGVCTGDVPAGACVRRMAEHAWATLLMVGWQGDPMGFFNWPGAPALPISVGWLFSVGAVLALWRVREPAMALLLLWWGVLVVPGVLSQDSPHFLRTIGAAPPTMLLWALPFARTPKVLQRLAARHASLVTGIIGVALVLVAAGSSIPGYFGRWAARPELFYEYMHYAADLARLADDIPPGVDLYLSEEYYRHPTYLYLSPRTHAARWFDARFGWPVARPGQRSVYLISPATPTDPRVARFLQGAAGQNILNEHGQYTGTLLEIAPAPVGEGRGTGTWPVAPATAMDVRVGGLHLEGVTIEHTIAETAGGEEERRGQAEAGAKLFVTLFWRVQTPTLRDLRVFLHLRDEAGHLVGQHDTLGYPSREWREGDRFVTFHTIPLPAHPLNGPHHLALGLYDVVSGERLPTSALEGADEEGVVVVPLPGAGDE
ncbi:MAG: hypothetical protein HC884_00350 [Chloroflexaceae bacterium]|nr:hypothetical protein [Chloroflexaceae bacterium]